MDYPAVHHGEDEMMDKLVSASHIRNPLMVMQRVWILTDISSSDSGTEVDGDRFDYGKVDHCPGPHDLVATIIITALATNPTVDKSFGKTLVAIAVVALIHTFFSKLTLYSWGNRYILGEPTILVKHGKIIRKNLRRSEISLTELLSYIRAKGFPDVHEVQYAILEPTGTVSVLPQGPD